MHIVRSLLAISSAFALSSEAPPSAPPSAPPAPKEQAPDYGLSLLQQEHLKEIAFECAEFVDKEIAEIEARARKSNAPVTFDIKLPDGTIILIKREDYLQLATTECTRQRAIADPVFASHPFEAAPSNST